MRGYAKAMILTIVCLAILIPFASTAPDGLEKVVETMGIEEHEPTWYGIMPDYTLPAIEDPYLSTLLSGVFGFALVLGIAFLLGVAVTHQDS